MSFAEERPTSLEELRFDRLLVAYDGSPSAELALDAAVTAAERDTGAITLLTVVRDGEAEGEALLRAAAARIPEGIPVTTVVRRGKAGREIVAQTEEAEYDAVLLGARGLGRIGQILGSVSRHVLHHAAPSVFVAHAPRGE